MRFNSLLLVAVLFACLHTSSTRSMSTSVVRVRSNKGNAPANPIEMQTITEERTFDFPAIGKSIEEASSKVPKVAEEMTKLSSPERLPKRMKLDESSQLHNFDTIVRSWLHQLRSQSPNLWISLSDHSEMTIDLAREVFSHFNDKSVCNVIDALKMADVDKTTKDMIEDVMIEYWKKKRKSSRDVFHLLRLDAWDSIVPPQVYKPAEVERFKTWIKFSTEKPDVPIFEVCKSFEKFECMAILDGLRQSKDTQRVESMEAALLQSITRRNNGAPGSYGGFKDLDLDWGMHKLLTHPNLKLFYKYTGKVYPKIPKRKALIEACRLSYKDTEIGTALFDKVKENHAEAELLLQELFEQRKKDAKKGKFNINEVRDNEFKPKYDSYVEELEKREDAYLSHAPTTSS